MDAFAAAKASQNEVLQRLVLTQVNQFFATHDIIAKDSSETETPEETTTSW